MDDLPSQSSLFRVANPILCLHFNFLLADFWEKLIKIRPRSLAERGDRIGARAFPIVAIQEDVMLRKTHSFVVLCMLLACLPNFVAAQSAANPSAGPVHENPPMVDHLHRLGLIDENWKDKGFCIRLDDLENAGNTSENPLQPLPTTQTDEGCGPDDFQRPRSNAGAMIPMMNMKVGTVVPAGYLVEVPTACDSDQLLAECLAAVELSPEKRAQLILKALDSVRRQTRDETFAEVLQSRAENQPDHRVNSFTTPSPDAYFKPDQANDTQDLREIVLRLERQQQLMQYQVQQMQHWYASIGRSLYDLESSFSKSQINNARNPANIFRLPEYSRPVAQMPQPLQPIYNPYTRTDDHSYGQYRDANDELRQLNMAADQIKQRLNQLMQDQGVSEARYLAVPQESRAWSTKPTPLLPR